MHQYGESRLPSFPNIAGKAAPDRDRQTVPSKEDLTNSNLSLTRSATATTAHPSPTLTHIAPQSSSATSSTQKTIICPTAPAKSSTPSAIWSALAPPRKLLFPQLAQDAQGFRVSVLMFLGISRKPTVAPVVGTSVPKVPFTASP